MDQVKEEAWYICKDVVDSVASKIILPLDFAVINQNEQTLEQTACMQLQLNRAALLARGEYVLQNRKKPECRGFLPINLKLDVLQRRFTHQIKGLFNTLRLS